MLTWLIFAGPVTYYNPSYQPKTIANHLYNKQVSSKILWLKAQSPYSDMVGEILSFKAYSNIIHIIHISLKDVNFMKPSKADFQLSTGTLTKTFEKSFQHNGAQLK